MVRNNFIRRPEPQTLARPVIEPVFDELDVAIRKFGNIAAFFYILPDPLIHIFNRAFFPGMVRMAEKDRSSQDFGHLRMMAEAGIVIDSQALDHKLRSQELTQNHIDRRNLAILELEDEDISRLAFDEHQEGS